MLFSVWYLLLTDSKGIGYFSTWDEVKSKFGHPLGGEPIRFNLDFNPFGSTSFYGYPGFMVEILKSGHIASVSIFANSNGNGAGALP